MTREVIILYSLFIDTHDKNVLIILFKDGKILIKNEVFSLNKHSEVAMPAIDSVMKEANVDVSVLYDIIVVNGPGSFTGQRIAVTIGKTMAYCLNIPIRVIDALTIMAISIDSSEKIVALEDRNGAFVGKFDINNNIIDSLQYINKSSYIDFKENNNVIVDIDIDYEDVYNYVSKLNSLNPHEVKPLYIKGISALNDK